MVNTNKHGLSRSIPAGIARQVRRGAGFGCVICGNAIFEYEHLDPPFSEALEHRAEGITLLCGSCHSKKTRGWLSVETVRRAVKQPKSRSSGYSSTHLDIGNRVPDVQIGTLYCKNVSTILRIFGEDVFSITAPEEPGAPFRINAKIRNESGDLILDIKDNELQINEKNWDVELIGRKLLMKDSAMKKVLQLRINPPDNVIFDLLNMRWKDVIVSADSSSDISVSLGGGRTNFKAGGMSIEGGGVAVNVSQHGIQLGLGVRKFSTSSIAINSTPRSSREVPDANQSSGKQTARPQRNAPCPCGSGIKFKRCHGLFR